MFKQLTLAIIIGIGSTFAINDQTVAGDGLGGANCAADFDSSGAVDGADLGELLGSWGACGDCPADLNNDGTVDGADLGDLLGQWGPLETVDFPDPDQFPDDEAYQIALEMLGPDGPLFPTVDDYQRIETDLELIRDFEPELDDQPHTPAWVANQFIVSLVEDAELDDYECLNSFYQVTKQEKLFGTTFVLTFAGELNPEALVSVYEQLDEVNFAEPNGIIGGENFWTPVAGPDGVWTWTVDDGFLDCFDGCDCHEIYTFETTPRGMVELIDFEQTGQSFCDFD